jgi:RNA polymerase sigma-70 factor (ECF subfamily)
VEIRENTAMAPLPSSGSELSPDGRRILAAIDGLPEGEREVFSLVHVQGLMQGEAAEVLGVSVRTVQRRLNHSLLLLSKELGNLRPN